MSSDTKKIYLRYIAWCVKNKFQHEPESKYKKIFVKLTGKNIFKASEEQIKDLAYLMRKAEIITFYIRIDSYTDLLKLSSSDIDEILKQAKKIYKTHSLEEPPVNVDDSRLGMKKYMKTITFSEYKYTLENILGLEHIEKPKKSSGKKEVKKSSGKKEVKKEAKKSSGKKEVKKSSGKKSSEKKEVKKSCDDYNVLELKAICKEEGHTKYSKLKKKELCKLLKIK